MSNIDLSLDHVTVQAGERLLKFYPLNFKALRLLGKEFEVLRDGQQKVSERLDAISAVLLASANRNGPQITTEEMEDLFDPIWATKVLDAVNKLSGIRQVDAAESEARPTKAPNGAASMQQ